MNLPETFQPFTPLHALSVAACGLAIAGVVAVGTRLLHVEKEKHVRAAWVAFVVVVQAMNVAFYLLPGHYDPAISLPLQVCDLAGWVAALALTFRTRWLRTALYYFGIGLCTQAFFTPTVTDGPALPRFWLFWITHTQIAGSALYDFIVLGYRPTWRDYLVNSGLLLAYGAIVIPLDIATGWNYGYVGPTQPERPTVIQSLGPWPLRLVWIWMIAQTAFAVLTVIGRVIPWRPPRTS
jgi:hypothetical integral membrane protein (TIGR02206 family)